MSNTTQCWEDVTKLEYDKYKENIEPVINVTIIIFLIYHRLFIYFIYFNYDYLRKSKWRNIVHGPMHKNKIKYIISYSSTTHKLCFYLNKNPL